jgi:ferredoxin-NADP reductase
MKLKLISRKKQTSSVESFVFSPAEPITWQAGQYLHYVLHHEPTDDRGSDRWFTIASAPFEKDITITTKFANEKGSSFKTALNKMKVGKSIEISDIDGDFIVDDPQLEYVFIAGGIGITPFYSILKEADHAKVKLNVTLLYANSDNDIAYKDELEQFAKNNPKLIVHPIISPVRIDEALIRKLIPDLDKPIFYISGPEPMVDNLGKTLIKIDVSKEKIKQDFFPGYPAD